MATFTADLSKAAMTYEIGQSLAQARLEGATPPQLDMLERIVRHTFRYKRRAAGLCMECGGKIDGHRCEPEEIL